MYVRTKIYTDYTIILSKIQLFVFCIRQTTKKVRPQNHCDFAVCLTHTVPVVF